MTHTKLEELSKGHKILAREFMRTFKVSEKEAIKMIEDFQKLLNNTEDYY